jgi:hypothetical protein
VFLSRHFTLLVRTRLETLESEEEQAVLLRMVAYAEQLVIQLQEVRVWWGWRGGRGCG